MATNKELEKRMEELELRVGRLEEPQEPPVSDELVAPPAPDPVRCARCGHSFEDHEPVVAGLCFVEGCRCKGWKGPPGVGV